jgi:tryptophan halogenase
MSAAILSRYLGPSGTSVTLIESEAIETIGVGEATIPYIQNFIEMLDIDEPQFLKETNATYKLGIEFVDWGQIGERYIHPFGEYGVPMGQLPFYQFWSRMRSSGDTNPLESYSLNIVAARADKFIRPVEDQTSLASRISYAYHFDATLFGAFLRRYAEGLGSQRIEAKVIDATLEPETGHISSVKLEDGRSVEGDFFIDCTGLRALLIEKTLGVPFKDWSEFLPMDSAVAIQTEVVEPPKPYTIATAREAGWTWRIPLQNRVGNGHVFSSKFTDESTATDLLLKSLDAKPITEPRLIEFSTGRRESFWKGNCLALGLSSGFLEPLESTSIHLIQEGLVRFVALMPDTSFNPENAVEYNRVMGMTYDRIRDFILLHYVATRRDDTEFWRYVQNLELSDILQHRITLLNKAGHYVDYEYDLFKLDSWLAVMEGQGLGPEVYNQVADEIDAQQLTQTMAQLRHAISEITRQMPTHKQYIEKVIGQSIS